MQREAPWLHGEVARRMAQRLGLIRMTPERVLDWWAHASASQPLLRQTYPQAQHEAVGAPLARTAQGITPEVQSAAPGSAAVTITPGTADLVWANMMLHFASDPTAVMTQWLRALKVDGFLMFSTLGPDTCKELRALYARQGWGPPAQDYADMHDIGDALVQAGFADPVMDQERLTLTWESPQALLAELRTLGGNAHPARFAGFRTPVWREQLAQELSAAGSSNPSSPQRIALTFEIIYGHAFKPQPRARMAAVTEVSLSDMKALIRKN